MNKELRFRKRGFTLIELVVVMAIIGVLTATISGNFVGARVKARDAQRKSDLEQIQRALELFLTDHRRYPPASAGGEGYIAGCNTVALPLDCEWGGEFTDGNGTVYMKLLPNDPKEPSLVYFYRVSTDGRKYQLYTRLENLNDPVLDRNDDGAADEYTLSCGDGGNCNYGVSSTNATAAETLD